VKDAERDDLFREARAGGAPTPEERARVRAALSRKLGVAVGAAIGAATVAKASASVSAAIAPAAAAVPPAAIVVAGVSALGVAKGVAVVALAVAVGYAALPRRHAALAPPVSAVGSPSSPPRPFSSSSAPALAHEKGPPPVSPKGSVAPSPRISVGPGPTGLAPANEAPAVTSGEELSLITAMQLALRNGENDRALGLVRDHERRFPSSPWAQEREGARVLATCGQGAGAETRRLGEAFLHFYPSSPLGARVRAACELDEK
jgi:hypothetical protein